MSVHQMRGSSEPSLGIQLPSNLATAAKYKMRLGVLLFSILLALTACGPEKRNPDTTELEAETVEIAQTFVQDGNVDQARGRLRNLDVANSMQWLVLVTETAISEQPDADETKALVSLAIDLGSQSHSILDFGARKGIIALEEQGAPETVNAPVAMDSVADSSAPPEPPVVETPSPVPTVEVIALEATSPPEEPTPTEPPPTPTAIPVPRAIASTSMNVRSGPGTAYPILQALDSGQDAEIVARNAQSDWWQVKLGGDQLGWVYTPLTKTSGDTADIAVAANIPDPPPTATPQPVAETPPQEEQKPPANDGPDFVVIEKRLWDVYENGGSLNGPTVTCGEKRQLVVKVVDANGNPLNGVAVQAQFGAKEIFVTGAQGKGDGVAEFILGRGQDVKVIRDADGREVTSEVARGMVTEPAGIPYELLIAGRYCTDDASCKSFVDAPGCWGHYSWTVTFQRKY